MRGLPFKVTAEQIQDFFSSFCEVMKTDVVIEELAGGKRSGNALVFFPDAELAEKAKATFNNSTLGNRYVEIYTHEDAYMQACCEYTPSENNN